ncbi:hypothetical protein M422DRAFT_171979, partial [Sphaerobolus stellatus SS14]
DGWSSIVLNEHSTTRAQYGASGLSWNNTLSQSSNSWAKGCSFKHSGGPYGENLVYAFTTGYGLWVNESHNDPGFSEQTGHFTQVVWKSTTTIGCALVECPKGTILKDFAVDYLVCQYYPPGNVQGEFP